MERLKDFIKNMNDDIKIIMNVDGFYDVWTVQEIKNKIKIDYYVCSSEKNGDGYKITARRDNQWL